MANGKNFDMIYNKHFRILYTKCIYTQKHRQYLHLHEDAAFPTDSFPLYLFIYMYLLYMENWENILFMNKLTVIQSVTGSHPAAKLPQISRLSLLIVFFLRTLPETPF